MMKDMDWEDTYKIRTKEDLAELLIGFCEANGMFVTSIKITNAHTIRRLGSRKPIPVLYNIELELEAHAWTETKTNIIKEEDQNTM